MYDIGAMFIFNTKQSPHAAAGDFCKGDEKGDNGAMLKVVGVNGIENPVEAQDGIDNHSKVVWPDHLEAADIT